MLSLAKKISNWFDIPLAKGKEVVEGAIIDYKAVQQRLNTYVAEGRNYKYVVDDLDGFNVEKNEFEVEYNDLQLVIRKLNNNYKIARRVCIHIPNDDCLEPVGVYLENYINKSKEK